MTRTEAMRQIAVLHRDWSLRYGDSVPVVAADSAPHDGMHSDYGAHQADRSAPPEIDDPLNEAISAILEQIEE